MRLNIELDTSRPRQDGTCLVRLTLYRGTLARYALDLHVHPKEWDHARRRVRFGASGHLHKNQVIAQAIQRAEALCLAHPGASPHEIAAMMKGPHRPAVLLLSDALSDDLSRHAHRLTYGTRKGRMTVIGDVRAALPFVGLENFTARDVVDFDRYLSGRGLSVNTRRSRLRRLRTMYRSACRGHAIEPRDIFHGLIPQEVDTGARFLSDVELEALRSSSLPTFHLELARDAFLLSYALGGVRFGDLCRLSPDMVSDGAISWTAGKVPRPRWAPIGEEAARIIERHKGGPFLLPILRPGLSGDALSKAIEAANASLNRALKDACRLSGIRPVTMHSARHTWAQRAKAATGDIHAVSRILGHARTTTTERYLARFDREAVSEVFSKMSAASTPPSPPSPRTD